MSGPDFEALENLPAADERRGWLDRTDPRTFVSIAVSATGVVFLLGLVALFFVARRAQQSLPVLPTLASPIAFTHTPALPTATLAASPSLEPPSPTQDTAATDRAATITNLPDLRLATLSEIVGVVRIKTDAMPGWLTVEKDLTILPGTTVLTDENSSVKITFSEGTVVRLSSQTQFKLIEMSGANNNPFTTLQLEFGKLWAIVASPLYGQFEVQMPVGVASVRGSFMSAEHNTTDRVEIVTCLEGHCRYHNDNGGVDLATNEQTESINGSPPSAPHRMDKNQIDDWAKQKIPEVVTLTPTRTPSNTPTQTFTPSLTYTASHTFTPSPTVPTNTPTATLTPTRTFTLTSTATATATLTPSITPSATPGPAVKLGFVIQPPASLTAGSAFNVKVAMQDASGAIVPYASGTITIAIGANPGGSTLGGTVSVGTVGGQADFPNLSLNKSGVGYTLMASASGLTGATSAAFTVLGGPAASLTVSGLPSSLTAGSAASVTVTAKDAFGNTAIGYTGAISFSSSDPNAALPANYTFTTADAGTRTFNNVVLKTAGAQSVAAADTVKAGVSGAQAGISVMHAAVSRFDVSVSPNPVRVGNSAGLTITAKDAYNNTVANYTGEVDVVLDDPAASDPANYLFTGSEAGTVTLANWITFQTPNTTGRTVNVIQVVNPPFIYGTTSVVVCPSSGPCP